MKFIKKLPVYLLGVIFIIFSIQFFVMIMTKAQMPPMNEMATQFMGVLFMSGFVWVIKVMELAFGILLVIPRTQKLGLILIAPIVVGIVLVEMLIVKMGVGPAVPGLLVLILTIIGIYQNRTSYMSIIQK